MKNHRRISKLLLILVILIAGLAPAIPVKQAQLDGVWVIDIDETSALLEIDPSTRKGQRARKAIERKQDLIKLTIEEASLTYHSRGNDRHFPLEITKVSSREIRTQTMLNGQIVDMTFRLYDGQHLKVSSSYSHEFKELAWKRL